jgi:hypothetical protein
MLIDVLQEFESLHVQLLLEADRRTGRLPRKDLRRLHPNRFDMASSLVWYPLWMRTPIREELADQSGPWQFLSTRSLAHRHFHDLGFQCFDGSLSDEYSVTTAVEVKGLAHQKSCSSLLFLRRHLCHNGWHPQVHLYRHGECICSFCHSFPRLLAT